MTPEERQAAIRTGAALIDQGMPLIRAAEAVGIPETSLRSAIAKLAADPESIKLAEARMAAAHVTIAERAAERLYGRIPQLDDAMLIRTYGVASDKVAVHAGWGRGDNDHASTGTKALELLGKLIEAKGTLTLTVSGAPTDAPTEVLDLDPKGDLSS